AARHSGQLDIFEDMAGHPSTVPDWVRQLVPGHFNATMHEMNGFYDGYTAAARAGAPWEREALMNRAAQGVGAYRREASGAVAGVEAGGGGGGGGGGGVWCVGGGGGGGRGGVWRRSGGGLRRGIWWWRWRGEWRCYRLKRVEWGVASGVVEVEATDGETMHSA